MGSGYLVQVQDKLANYGKGEYEMKEIKSGGSSPLDIKKVYWQKQIIARKDRERERKGKNRECKGMQSRKMIR